jgi:hypothetical protein
MRRLASWRLGPDAVADLVTWVVQTAQQLGGYAHAQLKPLQKAVSGMLASGWGTGTLTVAVRDGEVVVRVLRTGAEDLVLFRPESAAPAR